MEALSPTMEEGRLVEWKKGEGDPVAVGDVLAEVETDKAVMELVARAGGTLLKQVVPAGATVPVSELVALIGEPGEAVENGKPAPVQEQQGAQPAQGAGRPESMPPAPPAPKVTESAPSAAPAGAQAGGTAGSKASTGPAASTAPVAPPMGRVKASPLARRIAAERGIDLGGIAGTGPEGRVGLRDLEGAPAAPRGAAAPAGRAAAPAAPAPAPPRPVLVRSPDGAPFTDVPLSQIRKTIARRLAQSIGPIPTFYLTTEVDMERAWDAREGLKALGDGPKVSFNDIIIKAVATALRQHPACNAWWQDDRIRYWHEVHVSMAVAIEEGLITPVIRNTDLKSLREIAAALRPRSTPAARSRCRTWACSTSTTSPP
jgi:pyruvate dehydrogenase E2 component (dihydrolipoyllysine-residue acetyltransferase)